MNKLLNNPYLLCLFSLILFFSTACIPGIGTYELMVFVVAVIYCAAIVYLLGLKNTLKERLIVLLILIVPNMVCLGYIHVVDFTATFVSLPCFLGYFLGIGFGILIYYAGKISKIGLACALLGICLFVYFKGYGLWYNKVNYGNFLLAVNEPVPPGLYLKDDNGHPFSLQNNRGNLVILDFWNTGCGVCFRKFPVLQKYHDHYAKTPGIKFFAVNVPLKRDTAGQGPATFNSLKYTVPNLNVENTLAALNVGVLYYPTTIVIYNNRIIFRGDLEDVQKNCLNKIL